MLEKLNGYLRTERESEELGNIPRSIFMDLAVLTRGGKKDSSTEGESIPSLLRSKELALLQRLARRLIAIRLEKVLRKEGSDVDESLLAPEETYILEPLRDHEKRFTQITRALATGQTAVLETIAEKVSSRYGVARVLKKLPAVMGADVGKYGPFEEEDIAIMPMGNLRLLVKKGAVQEVDLDFE